ncbi:MAG: hypothetical protein HUU38_16720 [Anaerolineales bacterium]|nr:hypothetical protein [Anaerolineales bacterium]
MPKRRFALEPDGPERLEISWEGGWFLVVANVRVKLDGKEIAVFLSPEILRSEQVVMLPDGTNLTLCWTGSSNFLVRREGVDLSSLFHPKRKLKNDSHFLIIFGGTSVIWFIWELVSKETIYSSTFSIVSLSLGLTTLFLGILLPANFHRLFIPTMLSYSGLLVMFAVADFLDDERVNIMNLIAFGFIWINFFRDGLEAFRTLPNKKI